MHRRAAFTLIELLIALAIAAMLTVTAMHGWSGQRVRAQRASARTALVAAMAELQRRHALTGSYGDPATISEQGTGYRVSAQQCDNQTLARCVEVAAQPSSPDLSCGTLILRSSGERFIQIGTKRQPAPVACWQ